MRIYLIDGSSLAYRGYFAFIRNPLRNSKGENTSAIFAFTNSIIKLLSEKKPDYIFVAFDSPAPTHRHEKFEEYKAQRPKMPEELRKQIHVIKQLLPLVGISYYEEPGLEADDIIGSLAKKASNEGLEVVILSSDKDFLQLLDEGVSILNPKDFKLYDKSSAKEWIGVTPKQVVDFLALTGDKIDNIPGVKGIGPKTAVELLERFDSLDGVYSNIDSIKKEKLKRLLIQEKETAYLSRELATLEIREKMPIEIESLKLKETHKDELLNLLTRLEFFSVIEKLGLSSKKQLKDVSIDELLRGNLNEVCVTLLDDIIAVATSSNTAVSSLNNHKKIRELVNRSGITVTDASKDLSKLSLSGKENAVFDIAIASYLLEPSLGSYSISKASLKYLLSPFPPHPKNPTEVELSRCASLRASVLLALYPILKAELEKRELEGIYYNVELPLSGVLARMEERGVLVDMEFFREESKRLKEELQGYEERIYKLAGMRFNINSPKQLSYVLFEKLGLPKLKRTKTGVSTNQEVLERLLPYHKIVELLLQYREIEKIRSTYIDAIPELVKNGRVRTKWCQTTTATGRLSSIRPNLQNIPPMVREGFIAPPNWMLLSSDYSQIELRIVASLSGDRNLKEAFEKNEDIHTRTAALVFGIPEELIGKKERGMAKMINFGIIYGMGAYGLSRRLGISVEDANLFINAYFRTYPGVKEWVEKTVKEATEKGYTTTILGRKRYFESVKGADIRAAINAPVQGSAADMIKVAMINIDKVLSNKKSGMIIQVHDELMLEVPRDELPQVAEIVKKEMEGAINLDVPVVCDMKVGENWGKMEKWS
jgi:DNA polymerase-1